MYEYPFESHYIVINNCRLHYLDEGEGPVITMLHGNPTWSYFFRHLVMHLAKKFRVIVPDHMGCGYSDKPQQYEYTLSNHINNLCYLLKSLDITSTSLVVHDWGGAIGMGYATTFPERIEKIALLNTAAFRSKRIPLRIRLCRLPFIGEIIVRGLNGFAWPATFMATEKSLGKDVSRAYLRPYNNWLNRIALFRFVQDIPLTPHHQSYHILKSIEDKLIMLKEMGIPMLIVWGGKDFCFDDHFYHEWRRRFPNAQSFYLEDAGHYILEDGHGRVEPIIETFFCDQQKTQQVN